MTRPRLLLLATIAVLCAAIVLVGWLIYNRLTAPAPTPTPPAATTTPEVTESATERSETIGASVTGRDITVHRFGAGAVDLLFVGGIHGGYEWNSSLLAWQMIDYFTATPEAIPVGLTVHIIPTLNPDGLAAVAGTSSQFTRDDIPNPGERVAAARFNANDVDLNRNFDCNWEPESTWRGTVVSAGTAPFSEPEAAALRAYVLETQPAAVAFWHSQANNVYGSACNGEVLPATTALGRAYATAADYGYVNFFDAYPITGDAEGWLASLGIPAVTVELESFADTEFTRNQAGVASWFTYFLDTVPQPQ